jgi:hypothetical protein
MSNKRPQGGAVAMNAPVTLLLADPYPTPREALIARRGDISRAGAPSAAAWTSS